MAGVPQGSPLSPSVFTITFCWDYTGRDYDSITVTVCFYADDFSIVIQGKNWTLINRLLDKILGDLENWCEVNDFKLNFDKSKILVIGSQGKVELHGSFEPVEIVQQLRILGVIFDSGFNFNWHIQTCETYLNRRIAAVRCLRSLGLADRCLRAAAFCLRSKLKFGLFHLMFVSDSGFEKLEKLWTSLVRAWTGCTQFVPIQVMLE